MIAVGIVVALLAVSVPVIVSSFGDRRIEAEAERLGAAMGSLRAEAVRRRESLALYLDPSDGEYGGELIVSVFEHSDDSEVLASSGSEGRIEQSEFRERGIYEAKRPLRLSAVRPVSGALQPDPLVAAGDRLEGEIGQQTRRIRIAVCTASGQILASRPLWLADQRSMFRVELGTGVGNALLSSRQIIPDSEPLADENGATNTSPPDETERSDTLPGFGGGMGP